MDCCSNTTILGCNAYRVRSEVGSLPSEQSIHKLQASFGPLQIYAELTQLRSLHWSTLVNSSSPPVKVRAKDPHECGHDDV